MAQKAPDTGSRNVLGKGKEVGVTGREGRSKKGRKIFPICEAKPTKYNYIPNN